jgi:cytochrome P450
MQRRCRRLPPVPRNRPNSNGAIAPHHECHLSRFLEYIHATFVFTALTGRFPDLRLAADPRELTVDTDTLTRSLARLPVTW